MAAHRRHAARWRRVRLLVPAAVVSLSTTFGACESAPRTLAPSSPAGPISGSLAARTARLGRGVSRENENLRLLTQLPGYGGQYYDGDGNLNVYVVDPTRSAKAIELFTPILKAHRRGGRGHLIVRPGLYDIGQLQDWFHRVMAGASRIPELVWVGVDQAHNRLELAIDKARESQGRSIVARLLSATGIPSQAVIVDATKPIESLVRVEPTPRRSRRSSVLPMDTLADSLGSLFKNPMGGILISYQDSASDSTFYCTLGIAVTDYATGVTGFLTASHCSYTE